MPMSQSLEPANITLHGKRDFAGVTKDVRCTDYPGLPYRLNVIIPYKREVGVSGPEKEM